MGREIFHRADIGAGGGGVVGASEVFADSEEKGKHGIMPINEGVGADRKHQRGSGEGRRVVRQGGGLAAAVNEEMGTVVKPHSASSSINHSSNLTKSTASVSNTICAPANNATNATATAEFDARRIGFLIREEDRVEIETFIEANPSILEEYIPVAVIGEGTFSTVYKAIDVQHYRRDNSSWIDCSRQDPWDPSRFLALITALEKKAMTTRNRLRSASTSSLYNAIRSFVISEYGFVCTVNGDGSNWRTTDDQNCPNGHNQSSLPISANISCYHNAVPSTNNNYTVSKNPILFSNTTTTTNNKNNNETACTGQLQQSVDVEKMENIKSFDPLSVRINLKQLSLAIAQRPPIFVAIKRINATSGPKRIAEEIAFLRDLSGLHNVIPVVSAKRWEDQVVIVSPYFHSIDFRDLLLHLRLVDIAAYMRLLLEALAHVHANGLMHRDIKPSNFLFSRDRDGRHRGLLVDFGLAQIEEMDSGKRPRTASGRRADGTLGSSSSNASCPDAFCGTRLSSLIRDLPPGWVDGDPRVQMKASRAGTRGFRAPEVLFKVAHQTVAIDVWSAGVIMLTLLTRRYPFFHSTDDCDALAELACIFGDQEMRIAAESYDRVWSAGGLPSVPSGKLSWRHLCRQLNPSWTEPIPDEAFDLLDRLLDLNYRTRITALDSLDHPFLVNF